MDESAGTARQWREYAKELLGDKFFLLDPMRRKFVDRQVDSANEIVEFDLQDVRDADIILVNYNKPSIGTSMEIFYASHDLGKFVVAFSPTLTACIQMAPRKASSSRRRLLKRPKRSP